MTVGPQQDPEPHGRANLLWIAVPCVLFAARVAIWWRRWWMGTVTPSAMTGGEWFSLIFGHLAAVVGAIMVIVIIRDRSKRSSTNVDV